MHLFNGSNIQRDSLPKIKENEVLFPLTLITSCVWKHDSSSSCSFKAMHSRPLLPPPPAINQQGFFPPHGIHHLVAIRWSNYPSSTFLYPTLLNCTRKLAQSRPHAFRDAAANYDPPSRSSSNLSSDGLDTQLSQGAAAKRKGRFQIVDVPLDVKARPGRSASMASFGEGTRRATEGSASSPTGPSVSLLLPTLKVRPICLYSELRMCINNPCGLHQGDIKRI